MGRVPQKRKSLLVVYQEGFYCCGWKYRSSQIMKQNLWTFQWQFGLSKALCIAIDVHGFELLCHLGLASNNLFHPTCLLHFLFHLVFHNTNPMKQLLSYKYICLVHTSQGPFTESHVNNSATYDLHHIFLYSNPRQLPSEPGTKSLRLQRNNVLILIQTTKINKNHIAVGLKEWCFSQEVFSVLQQTEFTKKKHFEAFLMAKPAWTNTQNP